MKTIPRIRAAIDAARVNLDETGRRESGVARTPPRKPTQTERAQWLREQIASTQRTIEELQEMLEDYRAQLRQIEEGKSTTPTAPVAKTTPADKSAALQDKGREKLSELKALFDDF